MTHQLLFFVARVTVSWTVGRLDFCVVVIASDLGKQVARVRVCNYQTGSMEFTANSTNSNRYTQLCLEINHCC